MKVWQRLEKAREHGERVRRAYEPLQTWTVFLAGVPEQNQTTKTVPCDGVIKSIGQAFVKNQAKRR